MKAAAQRANSETDGLDGPNCDVILVADSTGDDDVNIAAYTAFIGASSAVGVSICGTRLHSKLILTPASPAEALDTVITCTCLSSTIWRVDCFEPAAVATNFTTAPGFAFA